MCKYSDKYNRKLHYVLIVLLLLAKEDADRDSGYQEPSAAYAEPSYAVPSYGDESFDLTSMLGPDPGVSFSKHLCLFSL